MRLIHPQLKGDAAYAPNGAHIFSYLFPEPVLNQTSASAFALLSQHFAESDTETIVLRLYLERPLLPFQGAEKQRFGFGELDLLRAKIKLCTSEFSHLQRSLT